ncbi:phosphatidylglycerophosphatase A [Chitiniphilus purpureus]|uniref:Phosphatidylglycerophosphatase A n=1 Tax=Chitiniphilus purpureus TaxID=2981137 RepID=A0ABY6DS26_9NEIS|nr:phosphatidylglycerophosphatase A [Chitiniphilus sp. CD1]UXY17165.1 phosphatidylglycerophosphatase A [Chitiniphilus sp. CD1]
MSNPATPLVRPTLRFMLAHPAHLLALGFGSGLAARAPGTWGTLLALPLYGLLSLLLSPEQIALFCLPAFAVGCWAAERTGRALGVHDHAGIVIDEIVATWLVLTIVPASVTGWLAAFVAFRLFDIAKPWPIRWFDRKVHGGFGVMFDDLLAGGYTMLALWWLRPWLM